MRNMNLALSRASCSYTLLQGAIGSTTRTASWLLGPIILAVTSELLTAWIKGARSLACECPTLRLLGKLSVSSQMLVSPFPTS
jgi:hypothetical protein